MAQDGHSDRDSSLPEVPLKWSDFMWSLERLRHKPYGKKMRERDWFRINPLEMVLLGCHSLTTGEPANRDHGTMLLVMEVLRDHMSVRPRYWRRLISVICGTCQGDAPPLILQRCCGVLMSIWRCLKDFPEFQASCYAWCITDLKIGDLLQQIITERGKSLGVSLSLELQHFLEEIQQLHSSAKEYSTGPHGEHLQSTVETAARAESDTPGPHGEHLQSTVETAARAESDTPGPHGERLLQSTAETAARAESDTPGPHGEILRPLLKEYCQEEGNKLTSALCIQLYMMFYEESSTFYTLHIASSSIELVVSAVRESSSDFNASICSLLSIIQLLSVRKGEMVSSIAAVSEGGASSEYLERETGEQSVMPQESSSTERPALDLIQELFLAISGAFRKWKEMTGSSQPESSMDVPCKLLSLARVILAAKPLSESLPEATDFFQWPVSVLMAYSTEGYLSDSPHEFMVELLEFVSSMVEQGNTPMRALQNNLPNLFGPVFGIRNHAVSCKLLEYGYLAVCSQHQKSLLTEGLRFLMNVFHLFPPVDEVRAQEKARVFHLEALDVSQSILEDLLQSLATPVAAAQNELTGTTSQEIEPSGELEEKPKESAAEGEDVPQECGVSDVNEADLDPVSDAERELDKEMRLMILLKMFQLACAMIRNGDNISFLFASILPKLFQASPPDIPVRFNKDKLKRFFGEEPPPPPSNITWKVDKKRLAIHLLDLSVLSIENDVATPFQLCGIVVPKLVKNLDRMKFPDEEKLSLTIDVLKITQETLEAGHNIDELISHGLDLLSNLLPESASGEELRQFIGQMAKQFVTSSQSSLLFLIKNSCHFMVTSFPGEVEGVQELFRALIFKGKRDEIRGVFRVCREQLKDDRFAPFRQNLYGYASGRLSHRQLVALCEILITAMDVEKPQKSVREFQTTMEEEEEEGLQQRREEVALVTGKLTTPCLIELEAALKENRFKKDVWEKSLADFSQIALFRTLFESELASFSELSAEELLQTFRSKFPPEVLSNDETMQLLARCATRIEHVQTPRYDSLKSLLSGILRHFLTIPVAETAAGNGEEETQNVATSPLELRVRELDDYLESLPRNTEDRQRLEECGYSNKLWDEGRVSMAVKTDGSHSLEENMRQTLLACYREFSDILKQMAITHVSVDGEMVKTSELFYDELSLTDLKGRRAIAVRVIDQRLGRAKEGHFYERKVALLAQEDEIETDFEKQAKAPVRPRVFTVGLNTKFFDCARCCGPQIIGCYAPSGEHCGRPLEIGLRCDSAVASIYDDTGMEIENMEVLFTEEGAYLFKAYSNGHPYDTSQVWVSLFENLLKEPPLLPAIIVPKSYPNQRTWEALRRCVSTEMTGSILTCRHDFSPEWRTYYDHRPERVRLGTDVVLHPGFTLTSSESRPHLLRQKSRLTKDLAGLIFEEVMQELLEDDWLKQFRFLGKVIAQYISVCIQEKEERTEIIYEGFDYTRWKKTYSKMKNPPPLPSTFITEPSSLPSKDQVVQHLLLFVGAGIIQWCTSVDLTQLCVYSHKQLLEMKAFLEGTKNYHELRTQLRAIHGLLSQCTFIVPVLFLPESLQEEVIHWVFRNEDRVWRYRGGRDGHETLQQFMCFLGREPEQKLEGQQQGQEAAVVPRPALRRVYAGVAVFCLPHTLENGRDIDTSTSFQVSQMIGYAVGEMVRTVGGEEGDEPEPRWRPSSNDCYEVVTAWVHPSYRGLNMGVQMYLEIAKQAPARLVVCDMLEGSVERIIQSNWLLRVLERWRILQLVVHRRQQSYTVVTQTGLSEQFEQVVFSVRPMRAALRVYNTARWMKTHPLHVTMATAVLVAIPLAVFVLPRVMLKL